jgi:ATP-dependent protease Clp ATPase subunit
VETVSDLEDRYKKHLQTFYLNEIEQKEQKENAEIKTELETPLMDDLVEFGMINYFLVYQIR